MRYTEDQKIEYVRTWEQTGLSRKQYSKTHSICYASFLSWTKKYGLERKESFIKLESRDIHGIKILLPNGVVIQTEASLSKNLMKLLLDV